ncbi:DUF6809 family protein [Massilicoli timonensis]|uniref:DUF6809 family protein n=1 Tax=Massilicoli timonensis TaxID=2015901 RepID=UPI000C840BDA|nr:DUF6809 family protein [Massilicoli timonensis]
MRQSNEEIIEMYLRAELYERLDCYEKVDYKTKIDRLTEMIEKMKKLLPSEQHGLLHEFEDIYMDLLSYSDPYEFENGFCYGVSLLLSVMEKEKEFNKKWKKRGDISNE